MATSWCFVDAFSLFVLNIFHINIYIYFLGGPRWKDNCPVLCNTCLHFNTNWTDDRGRGCSNDAIDGEWCNNMGRIKYTQGTDTVGNGQTMSACDANCPACVNSGVCSFYNPWGPTTTTTTTTTATATTTATTIPSTSQSRVSSYDQPKTKTLSSDGVAPACTVANATPGKCTTLPDDCVELVYMFAGCAAECSYQYKAYYSQKLKCGTSTSTSSKVRTSSPTTHTDPSTTAKPPPTPNVLDVDDDGANTPVSTAAPTSTSTARTTITVTPPRRTIRTTTATTTSGSADETTTTTPVGAHQHTGMVFGATKISIIIATCLFVTVGCILVGAMHRKRLGAHFRGDAKRSRYFMMPSGQEAVPDFSQDARTPTHDVAQPGYPNPSVLGDASGTNGGSGDKRNLPQRVLHPTWAVPAMSVVNPVFQMPPHTAYPEQQQQEGALGQTTGPTHSQLCAHVTHARKGAIQIEIQQPLPGAVHSSMVIPSLRMRTHSTASTASMQYTADGAQAAFGGGSYAGGVQQQHNVHSNGGGEQQYYVKTSDGRFVLSNGGGAQQRHLPVPASIHASTVGGQQYHPHHPQQQHHHHFQQHHQHFQQQQQQQQQQPQPQPQQHQLYLQTDSTASQPPPSDLNWVDSMHKRWQQDQSTGVLGASVDLDHRVFDLLSGLSKTPSTSLEDLSTEGLGTHGDGWRGSLEDIQDLLSASSGNTELPTPSGSGFYSTSSGTTPVSGGFTGHELSLPVCSASASTAYTAPPDLGLMFMRHQDQEVPGSPSTVASCNSGSSAGKVMAHTPFVQSSTLAQNVNAADQNPVTQTAMPLWPTFLPVQQQQGQQLQQLQTAALSTAEQMHQLDTFTAAIAGSALNAEANLALARHAHHSMVQKQSRDQAALQARFSFNGMGHARRHAALPPHRIVPHVACPSLRAPRMYVCVL